MQFFFLLLLTFGLNLGFAPGSLILIAQEALNPKVIDLVGQGIISAAILVIWYYTFKQSSKQIDESNKRYEELALQNKEVIERLFDYIKSDAEYKTLLTGVLTRLEIKIDQSLKEKRG